MRLDDLTGRALARRDFLRLAGGLAGLSLLSACGPSAPAAPKAEATKPAESKPAAPAESKPAAPAAPAAAAPTPAAATKAPATAAASQRVVALTEEPTSFDAAISTYTFSNVMIETHMLENLVDVQGNDLKVTPILAESWRTIDPNTWEFKLRKGVKWHNGDDFTSEDVKWTMDRMRDPKSPRAYMVSQFKSVETPDPLTVVIKTEAPYGPMIAQLTDIAILPKKAFEAMGAEEFAKKPIGTGAYKMVEWVRDQRLVMEANPSWWRGTTDVNRLIFRTIADPATRVAELKSGGVQIIQSVPAGELDNLDSGDTKVVSIAEGRVMIFPFNLSKPPFDDLRVRQAMLYGTDRANIVKSLVGKHGTLTTGPFTPKWMGFNADVQAYPYDAERAKGLLAEAGKSNLEFEWNTTNGVFLKDREVSEALAAQLAKIGVKMNLRPTERAKIQQDHNSGNFDMTSVAWGTRPDPDPMLSSIVTARQYNTDADAKALIQQARQTVDEAKRIELYKQVHKRMAEQAHWLFTYAHSETFGRRADTAWDGVPTHGSLAINLFYTPKPR